MSTLNPALATAGGLKCRNCQCFLVSFLHRNDGQGRAARRMARLCNRACSAWRIGKTGLAIGERRRNRSSKFRSRSRSCRSQALDSSAIVPLCSALQSVTPFAQLVVDNILAIIGEGSTFLQGRLQPGHWMLGQLSLPAQLDFSAAPLYVFATVVTLAVGTATYGLVASSDSDGDSNQQGGERGSEAQEPQTEDWVLIGKETEFYSFVYSRCPSMSFRGAETAPGSDAKVVQVSKSAIRLQEDHLHLTYQRRCTHAGDGGVISLDWPAHLEMEGNEELDSALLIIPGTVEGSAAHGVRTLVSKAIRSGYFPVVFNPRGCGSSPVTSPRLFSAADSDDLQLCVQYLESLRPNSTIVATGFGFGANILAKYLGEAANSSHIKAGICVANPFDLERATTFLAQSKEEDNEITQGLVSLLSANEMLFHSYHKNFDVTKGLSATSLREFDSAVSMVSHGFTSLGSFYDYASSETNLWRVRTPLLSIQAEQAAAPLLTVPGQVFQQNSFLSLLVSTSRTYSEGSSKENMYIFPDFVLEWLAAVELALLKGRRPSDGTNDRASSSERAGQEGEYVEARTPHFQQPVSLEPGRPWEGADEPITDAPTKALSGRQLMPAEADDRKSFSMSEDYQDSLIDMPYSSYQVHRADVEEDQGAGTVEVPVKVQPYVGGVAKLSAREQDHSAVQDQRSPHSAHVNGNQDEKQVEGQDDSAQSEGEGETERGQAEQAVESIMKVLDVTMPGTLSSEQKRKVIAAVGEGETILNAFQEAVPEDVRGKMFDAVSGAVQARGISSQLVGFGKNFPPPTVPDDVLRTIRQKMSSIPLIPQKTSDSSQTPQGGVNVEDKGDQDDSRSGRSNEQSGNLTTSDRQETSPTGQAPLDKPQGGDGDNVQTVSSPSMPGKAQLESQTAGQDQPSSVSNETTDEQQTVSGVTDSKQEASVTTDQDAGSAKQDEQSNVSPDLRDAGQSGQDSAKREHHSTSSLKPTDAQQLGQEPGKQDERSNVSLEPNDGQQMDRGQDADTDKQGKEQPDDTKRNNTADQSPSHSGPGNQLDQEQRQVGAGMPGGDAAEGKDDTKGKDDSNASAKPETERSAQDTKQDKKPELDGQQNTQGQTESKPGQGEGGDGGLEKGTQEALPDKSVGVKTLMPSLLQNASPVNFSSILQTFTSFDDSTQMAVTNVFGVVEDMLDKLEREGKVDKQQEATRARSPEMETDAKDSPDNATAVDTPSEAADKDFDTKHGASAQKAFVQDNRGPKSGNVEVQEKLKALVDEVNADGTNDGKALSKPDTEQVVQEGDGSNTINQMVINALKLELVRRVGQAGLEASGIDLQNELEKVATAVTQAVKSAGVSLASSKVEPDSGMGGKLGVLPAEAIVSAVCSALSSTSTLKSLIPVGVLAGTVLSALGASFLIATNDMEQNEEDENSMAKGKNVSGKQDEGTGVRNMQDQKEHHEPVVHGGPLGDLKSSTMVGAIAASFGAVGQEVGLLEVAEQEEASVLDRVLSTQKGEESANETPSIVSEIADKALSMAAPVVPKKEDGDVDQERIVAMLADLGQKYGVLRLLGKGALLWGGLRGAMSLTDRVLVFLKMSERPLHQRLLGFVALSLLLWAPIFVPLIPSLLEQWSSQASGGVAGFAAVVGLYGAVVILITIWGRRIRGYEKPLVHYGLRITSPSKLADVGRGFGLGTLLVASVYSVETVLGSVQFSLSTLVISGSTAAKVGFFTAYVPSAAVMLWKLGTLVAQACGVGFAVAFVEELLFRSWLQEEIAVDLGFQNAVLICAATFAIMHWSLPAMPGLFFLSIALAGLRSRQKGDLSIPIGLHAGLVSANYVLTVGGFVQYVVGGPDWLTGAHVVNPLAGALGAGIVAALALLVHPRDRKKL